MHKCIMYLVQSPIFSYFLEENSTEKNATFPQIRCN